MTTIPPQTENPNSAEAGPSGAPRRRSFYARAWAGLPRELGYLLAVFPVAVTGFGVTVGLFSAGVGTLFTFVLGAIMLVAALYVARGFGTAALALLRWAGRPAIVRPEWQDARARTGFLGWLRAVFGNGHYWLYLLHTMVIDFVVSLVSWTITVVWVAVALGGLTSWIWNLIPGVITSDRFLSSWIASVLGIPQNFDALLADSLIMFVIGIAFILTLPVVTRGLVWLHWLVARGVLAAFKSDALKKEVATLNESRGAAISAEGHSLRRLERDIHDGPQQRLVRLQMDLAAADRQLDADPAKARVLIAEAMQQSKDALEELRALSRGFAPPILLDRGLIAALESTAVRNPVPTRVVSELPDGFELPQEIERNAYFIASEALANAVKHARASDIEVRVGSSRSASGATWLDVQVTDNGVGGAVVTPGHGIAGLQERLRGLGGTLEVTSPVGGPTVMLAHLPVTAPDAAASGAAL